MDFEKLGMDAHELYKRHSEDYERALNLVVEDNMPSCLTRGYEYGYANLMSSIAVKKIFEGSKDGRVVIPIKGDSDFSSMHLMEKDEVIDSAATSILRVLFDYVKEQESERWGRSLLSITIMNYYDRLSEIKHSLVNGIMETGSFSYSVVPITSEGRIGEKYETEAINFFRNGMKFNKALSNVENKFDISFDAVREDIEEAQTEISKIIQSNYTEDRELVLSINPLDFVTMSYNNKNWSSCTNIATGTYSYSTFGSYRSGRVIMAYMRDGAKIDEFDADDKIWRTLIVIDDNSFTISNHYPYYSKELDDSVTSYLDKYYSKYVSPNYISIPWYDGNYIEAFYNDLCSEDYGNYYLEEGEEEPEYIKIDSIYYIDPVSDHFPYDAPEDLSLSIFSDSTLGVVYYCDFCGEMLFEDLDEINFVEEGDFIIETYCDGCYEA